MCHDSEAFRDLDIGTYFGDNINLLTYQKIKLYLFIFLVKIKYKFKILSFLNVIIFHFSSLMFFLFEKLR